MSIIKQKKQRVAIFIDAQNLYHSAKGLYGTNVNFKNILEDTLADRELVRAIAYVIATEGGEEKNFFEALKKAGIETKSKDLQIFIGGAKKGDWDVGMTVDAIRLAPKVDTVIIISGDGDFIPLVEYLKFNAGCQVEAATFKKSAAAGFIDVVDDFFDLSENPERYLMRSYKQGRYRNFNPRFTPTINNSKAEKGEEDLENETPEMVAERITSQRGISKKPLHSAHIKNFIKKNNNKKLIAKATEVEITRVKPEDFVKEKKEVKKKDAVKHNLKKVVRTVLSKKRNVIKKETKQKTSPKNNKKKGNELIKKIKK